jgi:hypothetical protein
LSRAFISEIHGADEAAEFAPFPSAVVFFQIAENVRKDPALSAPQYF